MYTLCVYFAPFCSFTALYWQCFRFSTIIHTAHGDRSRSLDLSHSLSVSRARGHAARSARASARPPPGRRPARGAASMKDIVRFTGVVLKPVSCIHPHAY